MVVKTIMDSVLIYLKENFEPASTIGYCDVERDKILYCCKSLPFDAVNNEDIEDILGNVGESFSEMLFRIIETKNLQDSLVYKNAHLDKRLFSKIRKDIFYKPSKNTALGLAFGLELDLQQTKDFIGRAGYTLSNSSKFDLVVRYFLENKIYDINLLNQVLFKYDLPLLNP